MNLEWVIKRVGAMTVGEIVCRLYRFVAQQIESRILGFGWSPSLEVEVGLGCPLFGFDDRNIIKDWYSHFDLDLKRLNDLVHGKVDLFSHKNIALGDSIDWIREPVSGIKSPTGYGKKINYRNRLDVGDIKILWELGRHQYLVPLAEGYLLTKNTQYRKTIKKHLESWIESCPFGYTIHWCSSLEVALRIISWSIVHSLLILSGEKSGLYSLINHRDRLRNIIFQHAWFIRRFLSLYSSANNHLIGELTGLWTACSVFDLGDKGRVWAEYASQYLEIEAARQVFSDGVDKEQAIYYHYWVLEYLLFSYLIGKRVKHEFSEQFVSKIGSMASFLAALSPDYGLPPQIGDADDGFVSRFSIGAPEEPFSDILSICSVLLKNAKDENYTEKTFWYSAMAGIVLQTVPERKASSHRIYPRIFKEGGYAILGDKYMHTVFDAGPLGYTSIAAHGHADALSICMAIDGDWWLVDPGTYTYHDNVAWRNYFRGTAAHNTVLVDDRNQSKIGGDFLWVDHANAMLLDYGVGAGKQWVSGTHDGYIRIGVRHYRRLEYQEQNSKLTVIDSLYGDSQHDLCWHWHLNPEVTSEWNEGRKAWLLKHRESNRKLVIAGGSIKKWSVVKGSNTPILGWYSDALGKKVPNEVLKYQVNEKLPCEVIFTFALLDE